LSSHGACHRSSDTEDVPTRLLSIGLSENDPIKLVETGSKLKVKYAALSHSWGNARHFTTDISNYQRHLQDIPFSCLPATFQEAISVCRFLGISYIWIDSCCIIQGSEADWAAEAKRMAMVYANSLLTIAATASCGDETGLFARTSDIELRGTVPIFDRSDTEVHVPYCIYARKKIQHPGAHRKTSPLEAQLPLLSRGWVYQERLLSTRVVHFGPQEIAWECKSIAVCQCGKYEADYLQMTSFNEYNSTPSRYPKLFHEHGMLAKDISFKRGRWRQIIEEYTKLDLTKRSDRLPALAGLARQFHDNGMQEYAFGLWKCCLPQDLLWKVIKYKPFMDFDSWIYLDDRLPQGTEGLQTELTRKENIPTWSWARLDRPTYFEKGTYNEFNVAEYSTSTCTNTEINSKGSPMEENTFDPLGMSTAHEIYLTSMLFPASQRETRRENHPTTQEIILKDPTVHVAFNGGLDLDYDFRASGPDQVDVDRTVFCLPLVIENDVAKSLVLVKKEDREDGVYRRIGNCGIKLGKAIHEYERYAVILV
jgi:hypothetical protein